ncbi:MAG: hypothetical protein HZC36_11500 [Armatimonadetes bacterium]|nr:hypothetical protein [Armatimonadota bacterium]
MSRTKRRAETQEASIELHNQRIEVILCHESDMRARGDRLFFSLGLGKPRPASFEEAKNLYPPEAIEAAVDLPEKARYTVLFFDGDRPCLTYGWHVCPVLVQGEPHFSLIAIPGNFELPVLTNYPEIFSGVEDVRLLEANDHRFWSDGKPVPKLHLGTMDDPSGFTPVRNNTDLKRVLLSGPVSSGFFDVVQRGLDTAKTMLVQHPHLCRER